jgi:hypothetical protein
MGRQIVTQDDVLQAQASKGKFGVAPGVATAEVEKEPTADTYQDRLLKLIPAEVIATYIFLDGVLRLAPANVPVPMLRWFVFVVLLFGTWFYLSRVENVTKKHQLAISTIAFALWVFYLGGPFASFRWYSPIYGAILLPLYTFGVAIDQKKKPSRNTKKNENGQPNRRGE